MPGVNTVEDADGAYSSADESGLGAHMDYATTHRAPLATPPGITTTGTSLALANR